MTDSKGRPLARKVAAMSYRILKWGRDHVPFGVRSLVGALFMVGGVFGFFPILGFWMFPLGVALIALDIPLARHKIHDLMAALKAKSES